MAPDEPPCVHWVARAVRADLTRVPEKNLREIPSLIVAGSSHPLVRQVLERRAGVAPFEGYVIDRVNHPRPTLIVAAHHFRGTMYGLLEISRRLGIDPLEYFTDVPPRLIHGAWNYPILSPVPAFKYRGIFINQEDLLTGWKRPNGPIPLGVYDRIFMCVLRLGANMILPATHVAPASATLELAVRRGLVLAQHHFQVLGTDVARLTPAQHKNYSFVRHREKTIAVWRAAIRVNRNRETVWTLGYRGNNDCAFWLTEPRAFSDAQKGAVISEAIRVQCQLLQEELGRKEIPCVYYLYRENQILYQKGLITVPPQVSVVWCDNGYGSMESYFRDGHELSPPGTPIPLHGKPWSAWPEKRQTRGGIYFHVAFYDCSAPNRVQYVAPKKIHRVFDRAGRLGLSDFLLVNVGNLREFVFGIRCAFDSARAPAGSRRDSFTAQWCRYYFGKSAKPAIQAYDQLYDAHWWWRTDPGRCFGDNILRTLLDDVIGSLQGIEHPRWWHSRCYMRTDSVMRMLDIIRTDGAASLARWQRAWITSERVERSLVEPARRFFHENVTVQTRRGLGAIKTLVLAATAADALLTLRRLHAGEELLHLERVTDQLRKRCLNSVRAAQQAAAEWEQALCATDRPPKWKNWSCADRIVLPHVVRDQLQAMEPLLRAHLNAATFVSDIINHLKNADRSANCRLIPRRR